MNSHEVVLAVEVRVVGSGEAEATGEEVGLAVDAAVQPEAVEGVTGVTKRGVVRRL